MRDVLDLLSGDANQFMFSSGPSRLFVAELAANGAWPTNGYHPVPMS